MSKVVTFSRSADYLHQRAMRNRREANMLDALDLMRRALEREPGNLEYLMDLAELYCEMGCHRASNRLLLQILSSDEPLDECYFGMSCNYIGMRDLGAAYALILRFLASDPEAMERPEVSDTLSGLLSERPNSMGGRKQRRAARFFLRGKVLLKAGRLKAGAQLLARSLALAPKKQEPRALLALCLLMLGEVERAGRQIRRAIKVARPEVKTRCIAVQVFAAEGDALGTARELDRLLAQSHDEVDARLLIHTCAQIGQHKLVHKLASEALKRMPYDAWLLHAKAVSMIHLNIDEKEAKPHWDRILRIDPLDTIAQCYSALCEKGLLKGTRPDYAYEVPPVEARTRANFLTKAMAQGLEGKDWDASPRLRGLVRWAMEMGDAQLALSALRLAAKIDRPEADLLMREVLLQPDAPDANKAFVLSALDAKHAAQPYLVIGPDGQLKNGLEISHERRLRPGYRRVLNIVSRAQQPRQHRAIALVDALWLRYVYARGARLPKITRPQGWAAALVSYRLKLLDDPAAMRLITNVFGCSERMVHHCAGKLTSVLQREDETHDTD